MAILSSRGPLDINWFTNAIGGHWTHIADLQDPQGKINPGYTNFLRWFHAGIYIGEPLSVYRRDVNAAKAHSIDSSGPIN